VFHQGDGNTRLRWLAVILCLVAILLGISLILHMRSDPRLRWAALVSRCSQVHLKHPANSRYPHGASFGMLQRRKDPWAFEALASAQVAKSAPDLPAEFKLIFFEGVDRGLTVCNYEPISGRVQYGTSWLELPISLRKRLKELIDSWVPR